MDNYILFSVSMPSSIFIILAANNFLLNDCYQVLEGQVLQKDGEKCRNMLLGLDETLGSLTTCNMLDC